MNKKILISVLLSLIHVGMNTADDFHRRMRDLNALLRSGQIGQEEYDEARAELQREYDYWMYRSEV
ncbi:hypothetical protein EBR77_00230, partial [bacterium]|nr:hypothetical protein [bacterium]